jgi:hypothetical protein
MVGRLTTESNTRRTAQVEPKSLNRNGPMGGVGSGFSTLTAPVTVYDRDTGDGEVPLNLRYPIA